MQSMQFSTENLLQRLENTKSSIKTNELSLDKQRDIWTLLTLQTECSEEEKKAKEKAKGEGEGEFTNKELMKFLFVGWWLHQHTDLTLNSG